MTDLATVEGVELASVGQHECLTGTWDCTPEDIQDAVAASAEPDWRAPVIKLGHTDPRFDGQPAVGTIRNLRASDDGQRLIGDLTDMPKWLADVMHSAYPSRSVEGLKKDIAASGRAYSFRLTALALLGVEPPAIESLADVAKMYAVAAANSQQASGFGTPVVTIAAAAAVTPGASNYADPGYQKDGKKRYPLDTAAHVRAAWSFINITANQIPYSAAQLSTIKGRIQAAARKFNITIAAAAARPTVEGAGMTPEQIREALGLDPGASAIEVAAKLAALDLIPKLADEPKPDPVELPKAVEPVKDEPKTEPKAETDVPDIADHPIVKELRESLRQLTEQHEQAQSDAAAKERDEFLADAVTAARITPAEREHYVKLWNVSPEVTRESIMARAPGKAFPIGALGHATNPDVARDNEFEAVLPDPGKGF